MRARFKVNNIRYSRQRVDVISKGLQKVHIRLSQTNDLPYVLLDGIYIYDGILNYISIYFIYSKSYISWYAVVHPSIIYDSIV